MLATLEAHENISDMLANELHHGVNDASMGVSPFLNRGIVAGFRIPRGGEVPRVSYYDVATLQSADLGDPFSVAESFDNARIATRTLHEHAVAFLALAASTDAEPIIDAQADPIILTSMLNKSWLDYVIRARQHDYEGAK